MPSVALHVIEFTFSCGFESYLRSHSFYRFTDGFPFDCPAIFSKTLVDSAASCLSRSAKIASMRATIALLVQNSRLNSERNAVDERERLRVFREHRREHACDDASKLPVPHRPLKRRTQGQHLYRVNARTTDNQLTFQTPVAP